MTLGPVMLDVAGTALEPEDRELIRHPAVGGVILFDRNYESPEQVTALVEEIHGLRQPAPVVAVDQEGGRVQRLREGFTELPPVHLLGRQYDMDPAEGRRLATVCGWLMAAELRAVGIDLSFAPVLDLDRGVSEIIGLRAFHRRPEVVADLARHYVHGMARAGMAATGKHFPGHGAVVADSHLELPEDRREYADIADDIAPFESLAAEELTAVMTAHIVFPALDPLPASFSRWWITDELRGRIGFNGAVFSDDLSMAGAAVIGSVEDRARAALAAGCDMVLVCNDRPAAAATVEALAGWAEPASQVRLVRLHGRAAPDRASLLGSADWRDARAAVEGLGASPELALEG